MSRKAGVERQLAALPRLTDLELMARFQRFYPNHAVGKIERWVLEAAIGYRLQKAVIAQLHHRSIQAASAAEASVQALSALSDSPVLIRQWKGQSHVITVLDDAVVYQGESYSSLDEVASRITDGVVSAAAFFGIGDDPSADRHGG